METVDLHFRVYQNGGYYSVELQRAQDSLTGAWELNPGQATQFAQDLLSIESNTCTWDNVNYVGGELWLRLTPTEIGNEVTALRKQLEARWQKRPPDRADFIVHLELPDELRALPWESLYSRDISTLGFAVRPRYGIVHHPPPEARIAPYAPRDGAALTMLVIAPQNSQLNVEREIDAIQEFAPLRGIDPQILQERVTARAMHAALARQTWDIVHYIGHGSMNAQDRLEIMLNDESGAPRFEDAELLCNSFQTADVRLAVFNCCRSSGAAEVRSQRLAGLGPMLMRKGVPAVVTMRYEIADHVASAFAGAFYEALLTGESAGRVDIAMGEARGALSRDLRGQLRSVITPVLHLAPGYHALFDFASAPAAAPGPRDRAAAAATAVPVVAPVIKVARAPMDPELREAIRAQRCIPIVGPGVLRAGITRGAAPPPGPLELVQMFTSPPHSYPKAKDLELVSKLYPSMDWMQTIVMQWVCQHHSQQQGWARLASDICGLYEKLDTPPMLRRLAEARLPALFYTWFDGMLHDCVLRRPSTLSDVVTELTPSALESTGRQSDRRPLVLLRGSIHNPGSLVITENDHEKLAASVARMPAELCAITRKKFPCSVLFIGLSPREPLVHQLCQKLLDSSTTGRRVQGPTFFLCPDAEGTDQAYWAQFETRWLIDELDPFLEEFLEAAS